jgi:hypothetical protein
MIAALEETTLLEILAHQNCTRHQLDATYTQLLDDLKIQESKHVDFLGLVQNCLARHNLDMTASETKILSSIETLVYRFIQIWGGTVWGDQDLEVAGVEPIVTWTARCQQVTERLYVHLLFYQIPLGLFLTMAALLVLERNDSMPVIRSHAIGFSRSPENSEATHRPYSTVAKLNHTDRFSSKAMMLLSMRNPITVIRMHLFSSRPARIPSNLSPYLKWLPSLLLAPEKPQLSMPLFLALAQFPLQVTLVPRRRHSTPSTPSRFHQHQIPLYHVSLPPEPWPRHNYFQAFPIPTGL